jgi:cytidine deaminase
MAVDQELVDAAIELAQTRFPGQDWSEAAALRLDDGAVLTSTAPGVPNSAVSPCGVCQERLFAYRPDVEVAVPEPEDPRRWRTLRLPDVQPHWFARVFPMMSGLLSPADRTA